MAIGDLKDSPVADAAVGADNEGMKTYSFKFEIDVPKYAARFGVKIPDDSPDELTYDDATVANDGINAVTAEDADVSYGKRMQSQYSSLYGQCAATLAQCRAKNPMTCRYHGAQVIAHDVEASLRAAGVTGSVSCELINVTGNKLSVVVTVKTPATDEAKVQMAMKSFMSQPGVIGDASDFFGDDFTDDVSGGFDIDMLDPNAKARWGSGQSPSSVSTAVTPTAQETPQATTPTPSPQPGTTTAVKTRAARKRTRPQTGRALSANSETPVAPPQEDGRNAGHGEQGAQTDLGLGEYNSVAFDENAPELYPPESAAKPPDWNPIYTQSEMSVLNKMALRLAKTAMQINNHIEDGTTATWLAKTAPSLPESIRKVASEIDEASLKELAAKDTVGQVAEMAKLYDEIVASGKNGWMTKVAADKYDYNSPRWWDPTKYGNVEIHFDESKYGDPYEKERTAFESQKSPSEERKNLLSRLGEIDTSNATDAPKSEADRLRKVAKDMDDMEDGFSKANELGLDEDLRKPLGRMYRMAHDEFEKAAKECEAWLGKQRVIGTTVEDTIEHCKSRGMSYDYLKNHQKQLNAHEPLARKVLKRKSRAFAKDPQKAEKNWKKNLSLLVDGASVRIAMEIPILEKFLASPSKGTKRGRYEGRRLDSDYVKLASHSFGYTPTSTKNIHKYAGLYPNVNAHDGYGDRYGPWEVELNTKDLLYFLGGKHSHTRYTYPGGWNENPVGNASMLSNASIATATEFIGPGLEDLFTHDYSTDPDGAKKVFSALKNTMCSYGHGNGHYAEVWIADEDLNRDKIKNIYPMSGFSLQDLSSNAQAYLKSRGIIK